MKPQLFSATRSSLGTGRLACLIAILMFLTSCRVVNPDPKPVGEWQLVRSGAQDSMNWELYATHPNGGGECLALDVMGKTYRMGVADRIHEGKVPFCFAEPGLGLMRPQFVALLRVPMCDESGLDCLFGLTAPNVDRVDVAVSPAASVPVESSVEVPDNYFFRLLKSDELVMEIEPFADGSSLDKCSFSQKDDRASFNC